jgi:hypothetical protein
VKDVQVGVRASGGIRLWDIQFMGERIAYEISLQEAMISYGGTTPSQVLSSRSSSTKDYYHYPHLRSAHFTAILPCDLLADGYMLLLVVWCTRCLLTPWLCCTSTDLEQTFFMFLDVP